MATLKKTARTPRAPLSNDWRTTDGDEIEKRRLRAQEESFVIINRDAGHPIFSNFQVKSGSGLTYAVEVRDLGQRQFACDCVDFRINGLGTCKHVEAVLLHLQGRFRRHFHSSVKNGSNRIEVTMDRAKDTLRIVSNNGPLPAAVRKFFGADGLLARGTPEDAVRTLEETADERLPRLRISQDVAPWLEERRRTAERRQLRHEYELKVQSGEWPAQETKVPLFPYQREGMLHLAFAERALLADEMGLGKTIQAIAACALLHRLGQAKRVLVVTPASLKTEWEEQITRFTDLSYQVLFGSRPRRLAAYEDAPFFTLVNYEQMVPDALDVNTRLVPDVVVLDEAQRIKNWNTKTAQAVKRLRSRYAFVLTGTPIENRIDELQSLMDFLKPSVLGPLFRFNRDFYELDERGRPAGYRNLDQLHARIKPYLLRRRKTDVETELPERVDHLRFVPLSDVQRQSYGLHEQQVMRLVTMAKRRPLIKQEQDKLQRELAMMRMICDTNYILNPDDRVCPKLEELEKILEDCRANDAKVIIFSEWERMLSLVRELCERSQTGFAWHTGSVPQKRRRAEINAFKSDPECRVFLSTDSGATGLNLQTASVVVNCDLPWNPAKLEQRIARAWRKHQTKPVTVINLVSENTIEHRMLETLALKQTVAESVLDRPGEVTSIKIRGSRQAFVERLQQLIAPSAPRPNTDQALPNRSRTSPDPSVAFAQRAHEHLNGALVRCEERYPESGPHSVLLVVVERDSAQWRERIGSIHQEFFGRGKIDPLAPTQLEVIDRATDEAIQRLMQAGLLAKTFRAARPLFPEAEPGAASLLSPEEQARAKAHRDKAGHALRLARLLGPAGFEQEAREHLNETIRAFGCAMAIEQRLPEPADCAAAVTPPLSHSWKEALPTVAGFIREAGDWRPAVECLAAL